MSVSNIYDTFLSLKITPDSKARLEEIREVTETILRNRDDINKMKDELGEIPVGGKAGPTTVEIAQMMELARQGNPLANFLKFKEQLTERDIGEVTGQKLENLSALWNADTEEVKKSIVDMGNKLREMLFGYIEKGETTGQKYYDVLQALNILTTKNATIYATELDRMMKMVVGGEEEAQVRLFKQFFGGMGGRRGKTTQISKGGKVLGSVSALDPRMAPARPGTTATFTKEGESIHKEYVKATMELEKNRINMTREQEAELLRIANEFSMADEAGKEKFMGEFMGAMGKLASEDDPLSFKKILPLDFPKEFWDKLGESELVDDQYKELIKETLTRSVVDMRFIVHDATGFQDYINELLKSVSNKEARKFLKDLGVEQQKKVDEEGITGAMVYNLAAKVQGETVSRTRKKQDELVGVTEAYVFFNAIKTTETGIKVLLNNEEKTVGQISNIENYIEKLTEKLKNVSDIDSVTKLTDVIMNLQATIKGGFGEIREKPIRRDII